MKRGDLVGWKFRMEMDHSEYGIIIDNLKVEYDPWPHWNVLFPERGVLRCRETDLEVIRNESR